MLTFLRRAAIHATAALILLLPCAPSANPAHEDDRDWSPHTFSTLFSLNFGLQHSNYDSRTNRFLADHWGPSFELEAGAGDSKLTFYFSPWTTNPERDMRIWNDTLYTFDEFNPVKWGLLLGSRFFVTDRSEWGTNIGMEWATFGGFSEKEEREGVRVRMPTIRSAVFGIDHRRDLLKTSQGSSVGMKIGYRYSMADYRVFNKDLGTGNHAWTFLVTLGNKTFHRPPPPPERPTEYY